MVEENSKNDNNDEKKDNRAPNRRPFATGSKPGPDELDHHLESKGLYRKHIARDASSLFRVVSEHVFDIQNYHDKVRQDLASFVEQNFKDYVQEVDKNIYNYCTLLRRLRTYGTLFDLKVMARMYRRNVILYEPTKNFQTTERFFVQNDDYSEFEPMRVFYSEQDKHFDIIFTLEYTELLADSQGIVYEILYKDVFKLPDVGYAVERMLHDPDGVTTVVLTDDTSMYTNAAGEIIAFDLPQETECVLKDPRTCHFHNQDDFEEVIEEQKDLVTIINRSDEPGRLKIYKPIDGFLHNNERSCVRQLLEEKITPFPYKVAKALDRSIYRNTEFELWSENRKDQRLKWLDSNGLPIREHEELFMHGDKKTTHTQITRDALDELLSLNRNGDGKKQRFQYGIDGMTHLEDFKMLPLPHMEPTYAVYPVQYSNSYKKFNFPGRGRRGGGNGGGYHHNYGTNRYESANYHQGHHNHQHQQNPNAYSQEMHRENYYQEQEPQQQPQHVYTPQQQQVYVDNNSYQYVPYEQLSPTAYSVPNGATHYIVATQPTAYPLQNAVPMPGMIPNNNFSIPPPVIQHIPPINQPVAVASNEATNLIRDNELTTNINQAQHESVDPNGNDLPLNDIPTLQFFFNLGIRYFVQHNEGVRSRLEVVANQLETLSVNIVNSETNRNELSTKNDAPPPPPANTPVSSKPPQQQPQHQHQNSASSGNGNGARGNGKFGHASSNGRYQNENNNNRRHHNGQNNQNHQNRDGRENNNYRENQNHRDSNWRDNRNRHSQTNQGQGNQGIRRESGIQFNSNVKNLHKIDSDSKFLSTSVQQHPSVNNSSHGPTHQLTVQVPPQNAPQVSPIVASNNTGCVPATPVAGISPVGTASQHDNTSLPPEQAQWQQQQPQQIAVQYYPYQPPHPNYMAPTAQAPVYYYNENNELMSYQVAPQPQPLYYGYPPQTPMYYQHPAAAVHPNPVYDDSGHPNDGSMQNYSTYPVYYAQPPPLYYPPTPAAATPHIMTTPVFPVVANHTPIAPVHPQTMENVNGVDEAATQQTQHTDMKAENHEQPARNDEQVVHAQTSTN